MQWGMKINKGKGEAHKASPLVLERHWLGYTSWHSFLACHALRERMIIPSEHAVPRLAKERLHAMPS
jgi:hypothetical protein